MQLVKENGKLRVFEKDGWKISIWDGGSITMQKDDHFIKVDHNKSNMKLINQYFQDQPKDGKYKPEVDVIRVFNKEAQDLLQECKTFSIHKDGDTVILDTHGKLAKFYRNTKTGPQTMILGKSKAIGDYSDMLKQQTRYVISDFDGRFITLEEYQKVGLENIFKRSELPLLSVM